MMTSAESALQETLRLHRAGEADKFDTAGNHVPMVLMALFRLGASADQLNAYYTTASTQKRASGTASQNVTPITREIWTAQLGVLGAWRAYRLFFQHETAQQGMPETLRFYIPQLMAGVAGHAFHPLIRLAYAIDSENEEEIVSGLAYWAAGYLPGPEIPAAVAPVDPTVLLAEIQSSVPLRKLVFQEKSISQRIRKIYADDAFCSLIKPITLDAENPLKRIALILAEAFSAHHHFTMLHGVTSCHALRLVLPYCENQSDAINQYWVAVCAAYLSTLNAPAGVTGALPSSRKSWAEINNEAIATGNEHTIKLAYTCQQEEKAYQSTHYSLLALRDIGSPAPFA